MGNSLARQKGRPGDDQTQRALLMRERVCSVRMLLNGVSEPNCSIEGQLPGGLPDLVGACTKLLTRGADVTLDERRPETDPDPGADSRPLGLHPRDQPQRQFVFAETCERHRGALELEAD